MKQELKEFLGRAGAFQVGIASPVTGYKKAEEGYSPLEVWPQCKSVVVFAVAMPPETNNTYIGPYSPHEGPVPLGPVPESLQSDIYSMNRLARQITAPVTLAALMFLEHFGHKASLKMIQGKVSGYEAGIGVYGKSGLLINPVLGNRMCIGTVMTDAEFEPDKPLTDFAPCDNCSLCMDKCPAGAYDRSKRYPDSWSRETCTAKRKEIAEKGSYCHNCFAICPAGKIPDDELIRTSIMTPITPYH